MRSKVYSRKSYYYRISIRDICSCGVIFVIEFLSVTEMFRTTLATLHQHVHKFVSATIGSSKRMFLTFEIFVDRLPMINE